MHSAVFSISVNVNVQIGKEIYSQRDKNKNCLVKRKTELEAGGL